MADFNLVRLIPEPFAYVPRAGAVADMPRIMSEAFCALEAALRQAETAPAGPPFAHYRSVRDGKVEVDVGFPVRAASVQALREAGLAIGETARGRALHGVHEGSHDSLSAIYDAMIANLRERGLEPCEDMWERYLSPPEAPPDETRTEVFWPAA